MTRLERELAALKQRTLEMGRLAESMAAAASSAMVTPDRAVIERVLTSEPALDRLQIEIDREVICLITVYSPVARDLRLLLMTARIVSELERIGDQAVDNCEYIELSGAHPAPQPVDGLSRMSSMALRMVHDALDAFQDDDIGKAEAVMKLDDDIDAINTGLLREALGCRYADSDVVARSMGLLLARSLERMADHATNICEEVFYVIRGEDIRHRT